MEQEGERLQTARIELASVGTGSDSFWLETDLCSEEKPSVFHSKANKLKMNHFSLKVLLFSSSQNVRIGGCVHPYGTQVFSLVLKVNTI